MPLKKQHPPAASKRGANPLYVKIGKRLRQARMMAKETNSRALSERLGWSGGRINNFETGISTPGVEETIQLAEALQVNPAWLTYGVGAPKASSVQAARHRNLMFVVGAADKEGNSVALLEALRLTPDRLEKFRNNPFAKIPDTLARRCEKYLGKPGGWLDETRIEGEYFDSLPENMRELLKVFSKLSKEDQTKLIEMSRVLLGSEG